MGGNRILQISKGVTHPVIQRPDFSSESVPWAGFLVESGLANPTNAAHSCLSKPTVFVCMEGRGRAHWVHRGVHSDYMVGPGSACFASGNFELSSSRRTGSWRFVAVAIDAAKFIHLADLEALAITNTRREPQFREDERLAGLIRQMFAEAKEGCPSGRLFGESLSLALLSYLAAKYAERPPDANAPGSNMSSVQKQRVQRYISDNLSCDLAVSDLAACIGVTAAHFSRLFKATYGISPYRFVTAERVARAKVLLEASEKSIASIALDLGFPSHSHFSKTFHKLTGTTPTQYKKGH